MHVRPKSILLAVVLSLVGCDREDAPMVDSQSSRATGQGDGMKSDNCRTSLTESGDEATLALQSEEEEWMPYIEVPEADETTAANPMALLADAVTYDGQISKLLGQFCVNCHKPGGDRPDLSTYALAKQGGPASLSSINRNRMPTRTPLVQADKDLFKAWSDAGFPQSAPPPAPTPPPAPMPAPPADSGVPNVPPAAPSMTPPPPASQSAKGDAVVKGPAQKAASTNCKK
jgi:hypothetical protein